MTKVATEQIELRLNLDMANLEKKEYFANQDKILFELNETKSCFLTFINHNPYNEYEE